MYAYHRIHAPKSGPSAQDRYVSRCQNFKRWREETTWKRKKIETSLVVVFSNLRYVCWHAFFRMNCFGNELMTIWCCAICILRGLSWQRVCCLILSSLLFLQIVLLWTQSTGVQIILTTNELVDRIRPKMMKKNSFSWKTFAAGNILTCNKIRRRQDSSHKMLRTSKFLNECGVVVLPIDVVSNAFSTLYSSESYLFNSLIHLLMK